MYGNEYAQSLHIKVCKALKLDSFFFKITKCIMFGVKLKPRFFVSCHLLVSFQTEKRIASFLRLVF